MDVRENKQKEVVRRYLLKGLRNCTLMLGTGFGKSKVVIDIIFETTPKEVLILVNSTDLRDNMWKAEFEKFNMGEFYEKSVTMVTYQTAYKWKKEDRDLSNTLIIADEVDFAADTPEYSKFFEEFPESRTIGITGFITEEKRDWFDLYMPVIASYSTVDAQQDGLLNKIQFKFIKYELSKAKTLKVEYKDKQTGEMKFFMTSENEAYAYQDKNFRKAVAEQKALKASGIAGKTALEKAEKRVQWAINNRNKILLASDTSAKLAKELLDAEMQADIDKKVIVFSLRTKQSEKICDNVYNGSKSNASNEENFRNFNDSTIKSLGVCTKVNRGVNFKGLNIAIFETFYGSDTQMNQRLGRLTRLHVDEKAIAYVLLPYFHREVGDRTYEMAETQQVVWARKALSKDVVTKENSEVIDKRYI